MLIRNVLVTGRLGEDLKVLSAMFPNIHFDFAEENDRGWGRYDGYIGFKMAEGVETRSLKWVHSLGAGVDALLLDRQYSGEVVFTRTIGEMPIKIAQYCLMCILMDSYRVFAVMESNKHRVWQKPEFALSNKRVLIFGTGAIGTEVARHLAFNGYSCYGVSKSGAGKAPFIQTSHAYAAFKDMEFTWLVSTLPLTGETRGYFDRKLFAAFAGAGFINVGRGQTVVEPDLLRAVQEGHVRQCFLDVTDSEPLGPQSALWDCPRVFITPHISGITDKDEAVAGVAETLDKVLADEPVPNTVDILRQY